MNAIKVEGLYMLICAVLLSSYSYAQTDTLYVAFKNGTSFSSIDYKKLDKDPDSRTHFPFNGGASYRLQKKKGNFDNYIRFHFLSWTLDGPWPHFDYLQIHKEDIPNYNFKDMKWFENTDYRKIVNTFQENNPVIFLLDNRCVREDSVYIVRVLFNHSAEE